MNYFFIYFGKILSPLKSLIWKGQLHVQGCPALIPLIKNMLFKTGRPNVNKIHVVSYVWWELNKNFMKVRDTCGDHDDMTLMKYLILEYIKIRDFEN